MSPLKRGQKGEFHHRDAEGTKLREEEIGASDVGEPLDGLTALHNHFLGLTRIGRGISPPNRRGL